MSTAGGIRFASTTLATSRRPFLFMASAQPVREQCRDELGQEEDDGKQDRRPP